MTILQTHPKKTPSRKIAIRQRRGSSTTLITRLANAKSQPRITRSTKLVRGAKKVVDIVSLNALFVESARNKQLQEMSGGDTVEIGAAEKQINQDLKTAWGALGVTTAGLLYPPLHVLSLPALAISNIPHIRRTSRSIIKGGNRPRSLVELISVVGAVTSGHYFAASLLTVVIYSSYKLVIKTEDHANQSLASVFGEQPRTVWIQVEGGAEIEIPFEELEAGQVVVVHAGQMIPIDGTIVSGVATVDQRALTGESQPVEKSVGQVAFASTIMLSGRLCIQVERAGKATVSAQIKQVLSQTADFKSSVQSRGERIINQGAIPTLAFSALALPFFGTTGAVSVLFASFGYHMQLAGPLGVLNFLNITSQNGILVKDGRALELLSEVDTVVFDKTGTLTEEVPTVGQIHTVREVDADLLLRLAAAAESKQSHPIAQAILNSAEQRNLTLPTIENATYEIGYGLKVQVESQLVRVGSHRFMKMESLTIPAELESRQKSCHAKGHTLVFVAINHEVSGAIELVPTIRPEAHTITQALRERGIGMAIISGDHQQPTQTLAAQLGIDRYFAEVLPQDKAALIEQLQQEGRSVCFIGDGINDSIALKTANVSISMRGASTVATDTAAIILMDGSLNKLIPLFDLAHDLDRNLTKSTIMTIVPGVICVGGVFFLHFGLVTAMALYGTGLVTSVANAMWPHFKHQRQLSRALPSPEM